jgi:RNA polymerase sigma-70 factor, ECF subfamily
VVVAASDPTDAALLARARDGDAAAFWGLMGRYDQRLFRIARSILRDEHEAEDTVQETYVLALSSIDHFREEAGVSTWLARIAINESLGRLRRRRPMVGLDEVGDQATPLQLPPARLPEAIAARAEIRALTEAAIDRLPLSLRTVFVMRAIEEMSIAETSAALEIPPQTVKNRFYRARSKLRRALTVDLGAIFEDIFPFAGKRCEDLRRRVLGRFGLAPPDRVKTS